MKKTSILALGAVGAAAVAGLTAFRVNYVILGDGIYRKNVDAVHFLDLSKTRPSELRRCEALTYLGAENGTDERFAQFDALPALEAMFLTDSRLGAESTQKLSECPALEDILLMNCELDAEALHPPALRSIMLRGGEIINITALRDCDSLRHFTLDVTLAEDAVTVQDDAYLLQDTGVFSALDQVTSLGLYGYDIRDISGLLDMDALEKLYIGSSKLGDDDQKALEARGIEIKRDGEEEHG